MGQETKAGFIRAKASEMVRHFVVVILDLLFLGLWAVPNVYLGRLIDALNATGIDAVVLGCQARRRGVRNC